MWIITNVSSAPLPIDGVSIEPHEQLSVSNLSPDMIAARDAGRLRILSGDETLAERKADAEAFKPFRTGDPDIDGKA